MTRNEAELQIMKKLAEIKAIMLDFDPDITYLSMSLIKHDDPTENDLFEPGEWTSSVHSENYEIHAFVQGGEITHHMPYDTPDIIESLDFEF